MIIETYKKQIEQLRINGTEDEWYLSKIVESSLEGADTAEAFNTIDQVVEMIIDKNESDMFYEHSEMLSSLCHYSQTTEIPKGLNENINKLIKTNRQFL